VLTGVTAEMMIAREETFGPVAPVMTFASDAEAIETANGTGYGLTAAVFTNDLRAAWHFAESLRHGTVLVNETTNYWDQLAPFGGRGKSGSGRELSSWMLDALTETKQIVFDIG
jgi:succinate-semialdehyde dehydrogenase / glutarate-semialdehyde dehydrogenase